MVRVDELAFFYPYPGTWPLWQVLACGTFLAFSVVFVLRRIRRTRGWRLVGFGIWTLVPVIGLVQVGLQSMADRYTYFPLIGVLLLLVVPAAVAVSGACGSSSLGGDDGLSRSSAGFVFYVAAVWHLKDSQTVYAHAIEVTEGNYWAHDILGHLISEQRDYPNAVEHALEHFATSIEIKPRNSVVFLHRGTLYEKMGEYPKALADFNQAIEISPQLAVGYNSRAFLLATAPENQGRDGPQALEDAKRACEITQWRRPEMLDTLAAAYAATGEFEEAITGRRKPFSGAESRVSSGSTDANAVLPRRSAAESRRA